MRPHQTGELVIMVDYAALTRDFYRSMRVTLCYDARAIDSFNAALFLQEFTTYLSSPDTLLAGALPSALQSDRLSDETLMRLL